MTIAAHVPLLLTLAGQEADMPAHDDGFLPHGYCYLWNKPLLWTHVTSDILIGASYVVISVALAALVHRARRDIPFSATFVAFGLFIVACGLTHFVEVWTLWQPVYWLSGYVKVVTAVASVSTAAVMPFVVPRVHATIRDARLSRERELAAARVAALEEANDALQRQARELAEQREEAQVLAEELEHANEELRQSMAVAADASRVKGDFLATMSHELRTPLNAIGGYVQLLEMGVRGPTTAAQREDLSRIRRSQEHLLRLIDDVLNFARLESHGISIEPRAVALDELLRDTEHMAAPLFAARGIVFECRRDGADVRLTTDPDRLQQILLNLLSNAAKFTGSGGRVTLAVETDPGQVRIHVSDTGVGIPDDKLALVFEPFVQLGRKLTNTVEGTGLGLAISRDLARALDGELTVRSVVGAGSTFTVTVPRRS